MKKLLYCLTILSVAAAPLAAQEYDDIYYDPKKDTSTVNTQKKKRQSNYIKDFGNVDVDEYNRRGQYYSTPIDTIGSRSENEDDFVYTQKIQKFYNPTIVIDNADLLDDVLNYSYGNVDIVFNNGYPTFAPLYSPWYWNSWAWGPSWSWSWNWGPSWAWGPSWSWSWNWGPSWAWGPSWGWGSSWGWGPDWGWGAGWRPGRPGYYADYRPNGNRPNRPGAGWTSNTRPGGNYNGRPGAGRRPLSGSNGVSSSVNRHRQYVDRNQSLTQNRVNGANGTLQNRSDRYEINNNGHRVYNGTSNRNYNGTTNGSSTNNHRQTVTTQPRKTYDLNSNRVNSNTERRTYNRNNNNYDTNRSYNTQKNNSSTTRSYNYNSGGNRSYNSGGGFSGGSRGGGFSGGGGGRGRHR